MTPVGRAILGVVLVAGAGPAGLLIYHLVFHDHPLPSRQSSAPAPLASGPLSSGPLSSAPASAPNVPTQTTSTRRAVLTVPGDVALPDGNGTVHHLAEYRGRALVLNFWATWCEPCQREIPLLQALHEEQGNRVRIVGVAVDFQKDVLRYAQARGITYALLMGEKDGLAAVTAFGMDTAFPFTVFADARGDILAVKVGELHADEARLILGELTAVDAGRRTLADARGAVSTGLRSLAIAHAQQPAGATGATGSKS
ncbi:MAG TPA: TlpA disulfide reductase family protein [Steroidobacteraceae bacterium]|nr:TlpA disulfide reductase family protein [Steroidobacteraceae bacterium]